MLNRAELAKRGEGQVDSARAAWNLAIDQRPALVAQPADTDEVAAVVNFARENGLRVAVQADGHGADALVGVARRQPAAAAGGAGARHCTHPYP